MRLNVIFLAKALAIGVAISFAAFVVLERIHVSGASGPQTLNIVVPGMWGKLTPEHQHTAYAGSVIQNQFEPLVKRGPRGTLVPHAALKWDISSDYTKFTFYIDTARRFSDGTKLSAQDFKTSWEHGLKANPASANNVVRDILYRVSGFSDFPRTGDLAGIKAQSQGVLEVTFEKPFRMALEQFAVEYLAAYRIVNGEYLGTGPYVISQPDETTAMLNANPFFGDRLEFKQVKFQHLSDADCLAKFKSGEADVITFGQSLEYEKVISEVKGAMVVTGQEVSHSILVLNGMKTSPFADPQLRRALQQVIWGALSSKGLPESLSGPHFIADPQTFLIAQAGRLSSGEADVAMKTDLSLVEDLKAASRERPFKVVSSRNISWLLEILHSNGIQTSPESREVELGELAQIYYKTNDADILVGGVSVMNGDPDGIYHALGKLGAIASPMSYRERVSNLLEAGRHLLDATAMDKHYKEVNLSILNEVPFIHLGYLTEIIFYNPEKIHLNVDFHSRHDHSIRLYEPAR